MGVSMSNSLISRFVLSKSGSDLRDSKVEGEAYDGQPRPVHKAAGHHHFKWKTFRPVKEGSPGRGENTEDHVGDVGNFDLRN